MATADDGANAVSIQLIGENSLFADTEKTYTDRDQTKKSFAGLYFHGIYEDASDRMTLNIGGNGSLLLDSPRQVPGLFDYYGIYELISQFIEARNTQHMTQEELALRVGTQKSNISRFESGTYNPTLDFLIKVAKSLGKDLHIEIK